MTTKQLIRGRELEAQIICAQSTIADLKEMKSAARDAKLILKGHSLTYTYDLSDHQKNYVIDILIEHEISELSKLEKEFDDL